MFEIAPTNSYILSKNYSNIKDFLINLAGSLIVGSVEVVPILIAHQALDFMKNTSQQRILKKDDAASAITDVMRGMKAIGSAISARNMCHDGKENDCFLYHKSI